MEGITELQIIAQNVKTHKEAGARLCESTAKLPSLPEEMQKPGTEGDTCNCH